MNWAQGILDDENVFPNKIGLAYSIYVICRKLLTRRLAAGVPFPRNFRDTVRTIVRRLFRVYAHIYSNHFDHICALGIEGTNVQYAMLGRSNHPCSTFKYKLSPLLLVYPRGASILPAIYARLISCPSLT